MSVRPLLLSLRNAVSLVRLYEADHALVDKAVDRLEQAAEALTLSARGDAALSLFDGRVYVDRALQSHESLEFVDFIRSLQVKEIDSIGITRPVRREDLLALAQFLAEAGPPPSGSVRLNESPYEPGEEDEAPSATYRARYGSAVDAIRSALAAVQADALIDLTSAEWATQGLMDVASVDPAAAFLLSTLKSHDRYTFYHSVNVSLLSTALAREGKIEEPMIDRIALGALLHDIGKAKVQESILSSPGGLDPDGERVVHAHPAEGARAILRAGGPDHYLAAAIAFEHHIGVAGSGYPVIPGGPAPHPASRLVAVADAYDALTTRRPYRRAETPARAQVLLRRSSGAHFDPVMVDLLHQVLGVHPVGSVLRLDDGSLAVVHASSPDRSGPVHCLLVRGPDGVEVAEPDRVEVDQRRIVDQLPGETVDIQPSAYLDLLD
ncbi:MAG: HD domain-containing protein [Acidimicrobiia bacterium]|nr:MAG: HD domain-containing protein [Acidimicrobiia bacterium]